MLDPCHRDDTTGDTLMADKVTDGAAKAVSRRSPRGNIAAYKHLNTGNIQPLPFLICFWRSFAFRLPLRMRVNQLSASGNLLLSLESARVKPL